MSAPAAVYVLAKNEAPNIGRCLTALAPSGLPVVVLDSGSVDATPEIARQFPNVTVRPYRYRSHCDAYNEITGWHSRPEIVIILDADMRADGALIDAIETSFEKDPRLEAVVAPVTMYWEGQPVPRSSLYPPKPLAFRGGAAYFEPAGHGERLRTGVRATQVDARLVHDDRKPYDQVLANQWRYAGDMVRRSLVGGLSWRDRLRMRSPIGMLLAPVYSYFVKGGFLDGPGGRLYALDRLIAEALAHRAAISPLVKEKLSAGDASGRRSGRS